MSSESGWKSLKAERDDDDDDDDDDDLIRPKTSMRYVNYTTGNYNLTILIILQIIHFNLDFLQQKTNYLIIFCVPAFGTIEKRQLKSDTYIEEKKSDGGVNVKNLHIICNDAHQDSDLKLKRSGRLSNFFTYYRKDVFLISIPIFKLQCALPSSHCISCANEAGANPGFFLGGVHDVLLQRQ